MANSRLCSIDGCDNPHGARGWCQMHYARWRHHGDPLAGGPRRGGCQEWLQRYRNHQGDECLIWPYSCHANGYGQIRLAGRNHTVSRLMCQLTHGEPPTPEHEAAHTCGNGHKGCANPRHLRWATHADNMADMIVHGTSQRGSRSAGAKLTEADVLLIRRRLQCGDTNAQIAKDYSVARRTISDIKRRTKWGWLTSTTGKRDTESLEI